MGTFHRATAVISDLFFFFRLICILPFLINGLTEKSYPKVASHGPGRIIALRNENCEHFLRATLRIRAVAIFLLQRKSLFDEALENMNVLCQHLQGVT